MKSNINLNLMRFIGTKILLATAMNRGDYCDYRGWTLPEGENPADDGFLVEYTDGGAANNENHDGYISWSPKEQFDKAYRRTDNMTFGLAIDALKAGSKVARSGWNGKGMFLFLVPGSTFQVNRPPLLGIYPEGTAIDYCPHIDMKTADNKVVPWLASQTDVLAEDWVVVD